MRLLHLISGFGLALSSIVYSSMAMSVQTITVYDGTGATPAANPAHPNVAVDSSNRVHVVWSQNSIENTGQAYNIFYKLIAADGSTLIDATQLSSTTDNTSSYKPQIAVSGTDTVYVSWHSGSNGVSLIGLDPSKDDLDGSSATLTTLQRFAEVMNFDSSVTGGFSTRHDYIDVDANGRVHILLLDGAAAFCAVYNADGTEAKAPAEVVAAAEVRGGGADVAVDENGKMHIVTVYNGSGTKDISYSMVDCMSGSKLIAATTVSTVDSIPSMQPDLAYDNGTVYIMWMDSERGENNCNGSGNQSVSDTCTEADNVMRFIALDPSQDDQNGNAASLAAITKVATKSIATPDTIGSEWYPRMGMMEDGNLQILFYSDASTTNLFSTIVDTSGNIVSAATEVMNDNTTAEPTSQTKAAVDNRATVYPEAQKIMLSLRDIPAAPPAEEKPANKKSSDSDDSGFLGLSMSLWSLLGLLALPGLLRLRLR